MSDELKDDHGRFVCQKCARNLAQIFTLHRRTEIDHRISYENGRPSFARLPNDGDIAAYRTDEYLCFSCCYATLDADEKDQAAELGSRRLDLTQLEPQEFAEYAIGLDDAQDSYSEVRVRGIESTPQPVKAVSFSAPRVAARITRRPPVGFVWGA